MMLAPGSASWLLHHELRMFVVTNAGKLNKEGRRSLRVGAILVWVAFAAALHYFSGLVVSKIGDGINTLPAEAAMGATLILVSLATLMLSMGLRTSVEALFERNDLELLLSSPLPSRSIFTVRLTAIVIAIAAVYLFFLAPFAHAGLVLGQFRWLAIYPTILSMALMAASLSMLMTLGLVRLIGIRRTRVTAQILGALSGAFIFLCIQANNAGFAPAREKLEAWISPLIAPGAILAPDSLAWTPGRALLGSFWPAFVMFAAGLAMFLLTVGSTHRFFVHGVQQAAGAQRANKRPASATRFRFRRGLFINIALKEWRSIWRDPHLISQMLLQMLYLLPLFAIVFVKQDRPVSAITFGLCFLMSSLTGSIAWLAIAAEDAPDLLRSAPADMRQIRRAKLLAVILPPLVLAAPVLGWMLATSPLHGMLAGGAVCGAVVSAGLIVMWTNKPANRTAFARRGKGNLLGFALESINSLGWAGLAVTVMLSGRFPVELFRIGVIVAITVIALTLLGARLLGRTRAG